MTDVFLDAVYAIALSSTTDQHHERAVALAKKLEAENIRLVTTRAVILEIGNALARQRHLTLLETLEKDPNVEIIPLSEPLYERALQFFRERPDKEWGITDCISFVAMEDRGLTEALTTDEHFPQAGFRALLRES